MTMMLRQKGTGAIYIYTSALAARDDMEVFESEPAPAPPPPAAPAKLKATATSTTKVLPVGDEP